jgi:protein-S-isoprenylcysteine O-methyltransferase Ste14
MNEITFYEIALVGIFAVAGVTAPVLLFMTAPYGRHLRRGWGPTISSTAGWILMESFAVGTIAVFFFIGDRTCDLMAIVFLAMWQLHYVNRTFIYPLRRRGGNKQMPMAIVGTAILFNIWNGYLNGHWLFSLCPARGIEWMADPRFIVGGALFLTGMAINHHSDNILHGLRPPGKKGYVVPKGGLFRFVSMPNYFGELVEWTGWAVATWSIPGLAFAVFTAANLVPRAMSNHKWYKERFDDYPKERKAIIPFVL